MVQTGELETVTYERHGDVGVWTVTDFAAFFDSPEMDAGEEHFRETASAPDMTGAVVAVENATDLGAQMRETLDHVNEQWSELADAVGVDRVAYVGEGMTGTAVEANIEAEAETESFTDVEEAIAWAQQA
jgi:hypothetical protein